MWYNWFVTSKSMTSGTSRDCVSIAGGESVKPDKKE